MSVDKSFAACSHSLVGTRPWFNLSSGLGGLGVSTWGKTCARAAGGGYYQTGAGTTGQIVMSIPIHVPRNGVQSVTANWTLKLGWGEWLNATTCAAGSNGAYCFQEAYVELDIYYFIWDTTNQSYLRPNSLYGYQIENSTTDSMTCGSSGCVSNVTGASASYFGTYRLSTTVTSSLLVSDHYQWITYITATTDVVFEAGSTHFLGHANGAAALNLGAGGAGLSLNRLLVQ